jgi:phosphatidylserine/phosphatidylglycerophosphate/cardiolipin synthase-like enzyme
VAQIGKAKETIVVQAFGFTSRPIADALIAAKKRGVAVEVLMEQRESVARGTVAPLLAAAKIPVRVDTLSGLAHNKIMILDGKILLTGSFNFTASAETRNQENLLILQVPTLAKTYLENYKQCLKQSQPYEPVSKVPSANH